MIAPLRNLKFKTCDDDVVEENWGAGNRTK